MTEKPIVTLSGLVDEIIAPSDASQHEKAQIAVQSIDELQKIRIDSTLTNENGDEVKLNKGETVKITIK
jgi:hypothetical protein